MGNKVDVQPLNERGCSGLHGFLMHATFTMCRALFQQKKFSKYSRGTLVHTVLILTVGTASFNNSTSKFQLQLKLRLGVGSTSPRWYCHVWLTLRSRIGTQGQFQNPCAASASLSS